MLLVGWLIVIVSLLGGYVISHGDVTQLFVLGEYILIIGVAIGILLSSAPMPVLKLMFAKIMTGFKGSPFNKQAYIDVISALYELFLIAREQGVVGIEDHVLNPEESAVFSKYKSFIHNHHAVSFMQDALRPLIDGKAKGEQLRVQLRDDIDRMHAHHHQPLAVLAKMGDAMPAVGIVAAVLGIVITMGAISGSKAEIGLKVAHALVGTFLGILVSYGFVQPLVTNLEFINEDETAYYDVMANVIVSYATGAPPIAAAEQGRKAIPSDRQPSSEEMEGLLKTLKPQKG